MSERARGRSGGKAKKQDQERRSWGGVPKGKSLQGSERPLRAFGFTGRSAERRLERRSVAGNTRSGERKAKTLQQLLVPHPDRACRPAETLLQLKGFAVESLTGE
jgi:hypothetical protein